MNDLQFAPLFCMNMINNLSIGSWNVNGLGDDLFTSCLKYDINILLKTWKGTDANLNFPDYKIIQKCRKKNRCSRRFSGGIIVPYKSNLHNGITEMSDMTISKNRIWIKLDKNVFGLPKDLFLCACYIPPVSPPPPL